MMKERGSRFVKLLLVGLIIGALLLTTQNPRASVVFRPIMRSIENKIVSYRTHQYQLMITEDFIIRYAETIDEEVVKMVAKTAEDKYKDTTEIFQYHPQEKILLVLYDDADAMMRTTMVKKGSPPMGVYYGDTLHILNPLHWVKDEKNLDTIFYSEGPLLHELVHLYIDHIGKGNYPLWFTEGVSLYFEYKIDGYEWGKEATFQSGEYTLEDLTKNFRQLNEYLAYTKSFRVINNFVEKQGEEALIEIIRALGKGRNIEEFIHLF